MKFAGSSAPFSQAICISILFTLRLSKGYSTYPVSSINEKLKASDFSLTFIKLSCFQGTNFGMGEFYFSSNSFQSYSAI